ncbi:MAG: RHS repeat domain-containing protein [bacterium]
MNIEFRVLSTLFFNITDANGHRTVYQYDPLSRLIKVIDPLGNTTKYQRTMKGRILNCELSAPIQV